MTFYFTAYIVQFLAFSLLYYAAPSGCVLGQDDTITSSTAVWMSVSVSSTLGFHTGMFPNVDCTGLNVSIMLQVGGCSARLAAAPGGGGRRAARLLSHHYD